MSLSSEAQFITGPQLPIGDTYFDRTQVAMAKKLGESCPSVAPQPPASPIKPIRQNFSGDDAYRTALNTWLADPAIQAWLSALNSFEVNLQYYDLALSEYITYQRTGDPLFLALGDKCADAFWTHPEWIGEGLIKRFPDEATPPPRHAGIMGLMIRALRGRSGMWEWIAAYVTNNLAMWLLSRIGNGVLWVDVREGAFALHYAVLLSQCLPDTFPLRSGGTATNGAQIRAQLLADCERIILEYYKPLQYPCGCWRYDADVKDGDGGTLVKVTQPFTLGLLLLAFADLHQITANAAAKQALEGMILKLARHLYADGPYRKNDPIPYDPSKRWRSLWYLWHGGTTLNPTKFEQGGWSYPGNNAGEVQDARQAIGPLIAIYGYAYKISGDPFFQEALNEMWDSAYGDTDGIRTYMDTDGKGFNQHCRRAGSGPLWAGWKSTAAAGAITEPAPSPTPSPAPTPTPEPPASPPSPDPTKGETITDNSGGVWTFGPEKQTLRNGVLMDRGAGLLYKWLSGVVYLLGTDNRTWYKWANAWVEIGAQEPGGTTPAPEPPKPDPVPAPPPTPKPCSIYAKPESINIPRNGSGTIAVVLNDLSGPSEVKVLGSDGQVNVFPLTWTPGPTSTSKQFSVKVKNKKQIRKITFESPCGRAEVLVNVI